MEQKNQPTSNQKQTQKVTPMSELMQFKNRAWSPMYTMGFLASEECKKMSASDFRVLAVLLNFARGGTSYGFSLETALYLTSDQIRYYAKLSSTQQTDTALKRLKDLNLIGWEQTTNGGYRGPRKIFLNVGKLFEYGEGDDGQVLPPKKCKKLLNEPIKPRPPLVSRKTQNKKDAEQEKREYLDELYHRSEDGKTIFGSEASPSPSPKKYPDWF